MTAVSGPEQTRAEYPSKRTTVTLRSLRVVAAVRAPSPGLSLHWAAEQTHLDPVTFKLTGITLK